MPVALGRTMIRLEGRTFSTPVIFAQENEPNLLGLVTLENALLADNPVGQRFQPVGADRF